MAVRIESQAEPIPGYRLLERLGSGGFGEVWKCEAPGGLHKAIKFVYGDIQSLAEAGARAAQELKGLNRVKDIHHPYILSLERVDVLDGQLVIVMELAHSTLWDRFKECRASGLPGVPREELLRYLAETAEALDMMNVEHHLQHLDIKPQNLFLVHNHVKVADFGLVKDLEGMMASVTGGVTPVYAAPETFDGKVSRFSDQYSLAIVYQEMLTGQRPFTGSTVRQLVLQHLQAKPDLSALPLQDQPIVARALSKDPNGRFPSCVEFMAALGQAGGGEPKLIKTPSPTVEDNLAGRTTKVCRPGTRSADVNGVGAIAADSPSPQHLSASVAGTAGPSDQAGRLPLVTPSQASHRLSSWSLPATPGAEVLVPALVVGLGGLGQAILRQLRREMREHFGPVQSLPQVRFLYLDTDPEAAEAACRGGDEALRAGEVLLARLQRPSYYVRAHSLPADLDWLPPRALYRIPRTPTTAGIRALGRLAFVHNYPSIARRLEAEVKACSDPAVWRQAAEQTGLDVLTKPRVYLVAGLAGGTGGGMFLDLAYIAKHLLRGLGQQWPHVIGILLLPEAKEPAAAPSALANAFAALLELHHFARPGARFRARYGTGDPQSSGALFSEAGAPFRRCVLLSAGASSAAWQPASGPVPAGIARAGHLLFTELCTPLGRAADRLRRASARSKEGLLYRTCGAQRIVSPLRHILSLAARRLCRRLVQRWTNKDARPVREAAKPWVTQHWADLGLETEEIITRLQELCKSRLGQAPEDQFAEVLAPLQALAPGPRERANKGGQDAGDLHRLLTILIESTARLEGLLGVPEECRSLVARPGEEATTGAVVEALKASADSLAEECELKLAQAVVGLIEDPSFRLVGAEESLRQLSAVVEQALRHQEQLCRELEERAVALYNRILDLVEQGPSAAQPANSSWFKGLARKAGSTPHLAADCADLLRAYAKNRYQSLVLQRVSAFYVGLRGQLSDQLVEVDFCRARLGELNALLAEGPSSGPDGPPPRATLPLPPEVVSYLLPEGCTDLEEAVGRVTRIVSEEELLAFDQRVQELLRKEYRAFVHVCMTTNNVLCKLAPQLCALAEDFLSEKVPACNVAESYCDQAPDGQAEVLRSDIAAAFAAASPADDGPNPNELAILALPSGQAADHIRELAMQALPGVRLEIAASGEDEIVFYREQALDSPFDLTTFIEPARAAYQQKLVHEQLSPHARTDVKEWQTPAVV
jgi:serine/threonine protein kinase